jgi:hypothetical protein
MGGGFSRPWVNCLVAIIGWGFTMFVALFTRSSRPDLPNSISNLLAGKVSVRMVRPTPWAWFVYLVCVAVGAGFFCLLDFGKLR